MAETNYLADFETQIRGGLSATEEEKVLEFLSQPPGVKYKPRDIAHLTDIKANTVYGSLIRLLDKNKVLRSDKSYYVPLPAKEINPFALIADNFDLILPLEIGSFGRVSQGDLVVVSGEKSSGKSCFLGETALLNMHRIHINYIVTENVRKIAKRFILWGHSEADILQHMTFIEARARNYDNVIKPEALNILDYYNPKDGDFTKVAKELEGMASQLQSGILVVGIQKATGAPYARGGELSNELSQLTVVLSIVDYHGDERIAQAMLQIVKEDGARSGGEGKVCEYGFTPRSQGSKIVQTGSWGWPKRKNS
jgi:hypothetical protein